MRFLTANCLLSMAGPGCQFLCLFLCLFICFCKCNLLGATFPKVVHGPTHLEIPISRVPHCQRLLLSGRPSTVVCLLLWFFFIFSSYQWPLTISQEHVYVHIYVYDHFNVYCFMDFYVYVLFVTAVCHLLIFPSVSNEHLNGACSYLRLPTANCLFTMASPRCQFLCMFFCWLV